MLAVASFATLFSDIVMCSGNRFSTNRLPAKNAAIQHSISLRRMCFRLFRLFVTIFTTSPKPSTTHYHIIEATFWQLWQNCKHIRCHFNNDVLRHIDDTRQTHHSDIIKSKLRFFLSASTSGFRYLLDLVFVIRHKIISYSIIFKIPIETYRRNICLTVSQLFSKLSLHCPNVAQENALFIMIFHNRNTFFV